MSYKRLLRGAIAGIALSFAAAAGADEVPISHFFTHNVYEQPELSPSGRYLSVVTWDPKFPERNWLVIYDLKDKSIRQTFAMTYTSSTYSFNGGQELFWDVRWVSDDRIVFGSVKHAGAFGHPMLTGKIYSLDIEKKQRRLLQGPWTGNMKGFEILRVLPDDPEHVVTVSHSWWARGNIATANWAPSAFLINTEGSTSYEAATRWGRGTTANGHRIMTSPLQNGSLKADRDGNIRFAMGFDEGTGEDVAVFRTSVDSPWKPVPATFSSLLASEVVDFAPGGQGMYLLDYGSDGAQTLSLYRLDLSTGKRTVLYSNPKVGIDSTLFHDGLIWGPEHKRIVAVETMYGVPKLSLLKADGPVAKVLTAFSGSFPGQYPKILSWSKDGSRAVVDVSSDRNPGQYYLVDVQTMHAEPLFQRQPDIDPARMASMRPIEFKARDGALIHGYLTLPNGKAPEDLPMIVFVHGGPHGIRDRWGFDPTVQLLANRGYAVLQINYRGSMGYGWTYMSAGFNHWGTTMQYDVIDGTRWAIDQGYADAERVCIFGASYGAYAAIRSAEIEPDLYQCTVGYDGVYDLNMMLENLDDANASAFRYGRDVLGVDHADRADQSPVNHVERLTGGIFLIQGGADHVTPTEQVNKLKKRLDDAGKKYEYLYKAHEGHGFLKVSNQREVATKLLVFFDQWIGAGR
ncbi:MAG TPA: alpha/beta fold hydrolase [Gammaproteobacteria bacterium]|nr:alpha/beta fold hydrolase [Gammaproteobacteria bacterium]